MLTAEQRIEKAHTEIMRHKGFVAYTSLIMVGDSKIDDNEETARTNGRDIWYGRKFVESLTDNELRGLILHEAKHKMYRHLDTWKHLAKINATKTNMACDYVINLEIVDEGNEHHDSKGQPFCVLPNGGLYDERFKGLSTADVFALLPDCDGGGGSAFKPLDNHDWENAEKLTELERKELAKEIDQAIRQGAILAGKVGGNQNRSFTDLMSAKVDWKTALAEFVSAVCKGKDDSTWAKPNRRWLQHDIYMPSTVSETMGRVVVAIDTSGSISGYTLNRFISEVANMMENVNPELVDLLYWDTKVAGHEVYGLNEFDKMTQSTKPKGGGGTDPECIGKYLTKNNIVPECAIVLTDGYVGSWGSWNSPVLWCILDNKNANPTIGTTIHIESGDM
jgi:predicted metal-dependent peptidase